MTEKNEMEILLFSTDDNLHSCILKEYGSNYTRKLMS